MDTATRKTGIRLYQVTWGRARERFSATMAQSAVDAFVRGLFSEGFEACGVQYVGDEWVAA